MTSTAPLPAPHRRSQHLHDLQALDRRARVLQAKLAVLGAECRALVVALDAEHALRTAAV